MRVFVVDLIWVYPTCLRGPCLNPPPPSPLFRLSLQIGTDGRTNEKIHASDEAAADFVQKMIKQKRSKGYE